MEFSLVPFSEVADASRWDGEFFRPYFRNLGEKMSMICRDTVSTFADPSVTPFNPETVTSFQYVEIADVDLTTGEIDTKEVSSEETPDRAKFRLEGGEILVSTVRPNRSGIGLVPMSGAGVVASSGFMPLLARDERWRSYLFVWFKFHDITDWLDRQSKASMYPAVSPGDILNAPVLRPHEDLLNRVHALVTTLETTLLRGREMYPEAEQELLNRMNWQTLNKHRVESTFVQTFSAFAQAGRIDAEHYHPRFERLRTHLECMGAKRLGELCLSIDKGTQPDAYVDGGEVTVVKSKNVFGEGIDFDNCDRTTLHAYDDQAAHLHEGDVVINATGMGTLGRAAFIPARNEKIIGAVDLLIMRLDRNLIVPEYLSLFLNSPAGLMQSEMLQTGSSGQLHLYPHHVEQFLIFIPQNDDGSVDLEWQRRLADKVEAATQAKQEAQRILGQAKRLIEESVESAVIR